MPAEVHLSVAQYQALNDLSEAVTGVVVTAALVVALLIAVLALAEAARAWVATRRSTVAHHSTVDRTRHRWHV
jgi:hypothetical protein